MEYVTLKNSDLKVSRLCMGGCPMGGYGWGDVSNSDLVEAVHVALDNGVTFFDTADTYGLGKSEELLGEALSGKREHAVIASKFGVRVENGKTFYDNSPFWISKAIGLTLKRLRVDYLDLYQVHYRDAVTPIRDVIESLERLKEQGFIRYYGLSNVTRKDMEELASYTGKFVTFQNEYSLACRDHEEDITKLAEVLQLTPLTWGSLGQGILTGKYDQSASFDTNDRRSRDVYVNFHGAKLERNLQIVDVLRGISLETGRTIPSIAIRFILDHISDSVVLVGVKNTNQILSNVQSMDWHLTTAQKRKLIEISAP